MVICNNVFVIYKNLHNTYILLLLVIYNINLFVMILFRLYSQYPQKLKQVVVEESFVVLVVCATCVLQ